MLRPLRVCIAIPSFDRLGAQRVAFTLARFMDRARFEPFFLVHSAEGDLASAAPSDVEVVEVDRYIPRTSRGRSITRLRGYARALRTHRPDIALGIVQYPTLALAAARWQLRERWPIVACEHSFVTKNIEDTTAYGPAFRFVYRHSLEHIYNSVVERVLMTADEGRDDLVGNFGVAREQVVVVPNPIDGPRIRATAAAPLDHPWLASDETSHNEVPVITGAGRLVEQKRFEHLVRAFAKVRARREARLLILGEGPDRGALEALAKSLGVAADVRFDDVSPPWGHMSRSNLFVLSSVWEGFPMVLAEAMALGCRIVSYACPSGPREMLDDGACGVLVPTGDVDALASSIEAALAERPRMDALARAAKKKAENYEARAVVSMYESLFDTLVGARR